MKATMSGSARCTAMLHGDIEVALLDTGAAHALLTLYGTKRILQFQLDPAQLAEMAAWEAHYWANDYEPSPATCTEEIHEDVASFVFVARSRMAFTIAAQLEAKEADIRAVAELATAVLLVTRGVCEP